MFNNMCLPASNPSYYQPIIESIHQGRVFLLNFFMDLYWVGLLDEGLFRGIGRWLARPKFDFQFVYVVLQETNQFGVSDICFCLHWMYGLWKLLSPVDYLLKDAGELP